MRVWLRLLSLTSYSTPTQSAFAAKWWCVQIVQTHYSVCVLSCWSSVVKRSFSVSDEAFQHCHCWTITSGWVKINRSSLQQQLDFILVTFRHVRIIFSINKTTNSGPQSFSHEQQKIEIQFVTKFSFSDLSGVNPPHARINKGSLKKKIYRHVQHCQRCQVCSQLIIFITQRKSLEGTLQANAKLTAS